MRGVWRTFTAEGNNKTAADQYPTLEDPGRIELPLRGLQSRPCPFGRVQDGGPSRGEPGPTTALPQVMCAHGKRKEQQSVAH